MLESDREMIASPSWQEGPELTNVPVQHPVNEMSVTFKIAILSTSCSPVEEATQLICLLTQEVWP